nr:FAD-dependent oxidoreductase [Acidaminococcus fermentans]
MIIGGGPAGMEAAIIACDRGHQVTLVDDHSSLGGTLYFTNVDVDKPDLRYDKDRLVRQVDRRNIQVRLNTMADEALIREEKPDAVILAIGVVPSALPLKGLDTVPQAMFVYDHPEQVTGRNIIMLGGGLVGCEVGLHLAKSGHQVTIVEMMDTIAKDSYGMYKEALFREMDRYGIRLLPGTQCLEVKGNRVRVRNSQGQEEELQGDQVFYALGLKARSTEALKKACGDIPCWEIGNCIHVGQVDIALKEGWQAAVEL